jgi:hypothetical protein
MNRIAPELKRLFRWARSAPPPLAAQAPLGFSHRVVGLWLQAGPPEAFWLWQTAVIKSAWAAAAIILVGLALLTAKQAGQKSAYDFTPAYEVVSTQVVP